MSTIRQHLEANDQLLGFALHAADVAAPESLEEAIKQARKHAVAALKALDEAEWSTLYAATTEGPDQPHYFRLVPDPAPPARNT